MRSAEEGWIASSPASMLPVPYATHLGPGYGRLPAVLQVPTRTGLGAIPIKLAGPSVNRAEKVSVLVALTGSGPVVTTFLHRSEAVLAAGESSHMPPPLRMLMVTG